MERLYYLLFKRFECLSGMNLGPLANFGDIPNIILRTERNKSWPFNHGNNTLNYIYSYC